MLRRYTTRVSLKSLQGKSLYPKPLNLNIVPPKKADLKEAIKPVIKDKTPSPQPKSQNMIQVNTKPKVEPELLSIGLDEPKAKKIDPRKATGKDRDRVKRMRALETKEIKKQNQSKEKKKKQKDIYLQEGITIANLSSLLETPYGNLDWL